MTWMRSASAALQLGLAHLGPTHRHIFDWFYARLGEWFTYDEAASGCGLGYHPFRVGLQRLRNSLEGSDYEFQGMGRRWGRTLRLTRRTS